MSLSVFSKENFKKHLLDLGLVRGDNIILHSRLVSFGLVPGGPESFYEALLEVVGESSLIVVPTYTFQLTGDDIYDPQTTSSDNMGVVSKYLRQLPNAFRSACPIHNHACVGQKAIEISLLEGDFSFGPKSDFDWMSNYDFKLVLLGCGFDIAGTQVFHTMTYFNVPYRRWIKIPRKRRNLDGTVSEISVNYFARDPGFQEDISKPLELLSERNQINIISAPSGFSYAMSLGNFRSTCFDLMDKCPNVFLKNS